MIYLRTSETVHEAVRASLDSQWSHPKIENGVETLTCIEPAATAPKDDEGRILIALRNREEAMPEVSPMLETLLSGGLVEEVDHETYHAALPKMQLPAFPPPGS